VTLRASDANQLGILGFGGDRGDYHVLAQGSLGFFLTDNLVLGGEYRQKPNNLSAFREDDFKDVFPVLHCAEVRLGEARLCRSGQYRR
jgi:hypothetical protein